MRALVQRVTSAAVVIGGETVGAIGPGLLVLVCGMAGDDDAKPALLADKVVKLRVFRDEAGKMNRSLLDTGFAALLVSQFTLAADTSRGNRPGFSAAAAPADGERLYGAFARMVAARGVPTATGRFGADMAVSLVNDGPVTIWLEV